MQTIKYNILIFIILIVHSSLYANWKSERENLDNVYKFSTFRIFYTLNGKNELIDKTDTNKNNIPDIVENIALQLDTADKLFHNILGFEQPILSQRYKNDVKYVDIHMLSLKYNGESGDGVIKYNYKIIKHNTKTLSIAISNNIKAENLTPSHELFHTYQNGYTMFKNRWFTEGTARWSEKIFENGTGKQHKLPSTIQKIQKLLTKTYDAEYFWNRLVRICTKQPKTFHIPNSLKNKTYINSSLFVINGNDIYGIDFMKLLFENLDYYDDLATKDMSYKKYGWRETEQKDFKNNLYILMAIERTIYQIKPKKTKELDVFLDVLNQYLQETKKINKIVDLTNNIQEIGIPYKNEYKNNTEDVYSRNVWDIKAFNGKLYFGAGNSSNSKPSANSGPVPVISYDIKSKKMIDEYTVDEESIELFRIIDNKLFIPGTDATQSHKFGNLYVNDRLEWKKYRTIPGALHVFDMVLFNNKLFAAISTKKGAAVGISLDFGTTWEIQYLGKYQRAFSLIRVKNKLYVLKQLWHNEKFEEMASKIDGSYFFISEYSGDKFIPRYDLKLKDLFPYDKINRNRTIRVSKSEKFFDKTVYLASYYYDKPFAFFIASNLDKSKAIVEHIKTPILFQPMDLAVVDNEIFLLVSKKNYKEVESLVLKISKDDLSKIDVLFKFNTKTMVRSFEVYKNSFYFGLGSSVKNKKRWKQKELHPQTGRVLKIEL